ncbi:outer membrane beta-barrel family protein [Flavobacterium johnsoniae]|uniref:hypothetical protein n=1 Tax=Flavobacterium johnsoniae TaxID=986 RepID=UPI0025B046BF|nr:hypothetical protein [Flavobacterium johnsoniae]WJS96838.1 outer membrane beta-barrel family protein [Flavobacterium johnsoniae]
MIKRFIFILLFFIQWSYSQKIVGKINDQNGSPIQVATLLMREGTDENPIQEYKTVRNGQFSFQLKNNYKSLLLEVKSFGYLSEKIVLSNPETDKTYHYDIQLFSDSKIVLKEVIIEKPKAIEVVEDTTKYNVKSFLNGNESKIIDVIKKLPGIEVNEKSGIIKFKGKSIETVTLGGDNLFDSNYTIGTKNINVNMVDQVQAIENYNENPLLKGFETGDKVALNLVLKKGMVDLSGSMEYGNGWNDSGEPMNKIDALLLGISNKNKSFTTINFNNLGENKSPIDYYGFQFNAEALKEDQLKVSKTLPESVFSSNLSDDRVNLNNQLFASYNSIFTITKQLKLKTNLSFINDRISAQRAYENTYYLESGDIHTTDYTNILKKPRQYRADFNLKYNLKKDASLTYDLKLQKEDIITPTEDLQNKTTVFESRLTSESRYFNQKAQFIKRFSTDNAFQATFLHAISEIPQTFNVTPDITIDPLVNVNFQEVNPKKQFVNADFLLLGKKNKKKFNFSAGWIFNSTSFLSQLSDSDVDAPASFQNNYDYQKSKIYQNGLFKYFINRWTFEAKYSLSYLHQEFTDYETSVNQKKNDFVFEPSLNLSYKLNETDILSFNALYSQKPLDERHLFSNWILTNTRSLIQNTPLLNFTKTKRISINYNKSDLFNQFLMNGGITFQTDNGNFFQNTTISSQLNKSTYFFLPTNNNQWNADFSITKLIPYLSSTFRLNSNYSLNNYQNRINNSELRNNQGQAFRESLYVKTAFDLKWNFENETSYILNVFKSDENQNKNKNSILENHFKLYYNPSKTWNMTAISDYFIPSLNNPSNDYLFVDFEVKHNPKHKKWEAAFVLKNIFNENKFEQIQITDYSLNKYSYNLLPRYFLLKLKWNF